LTRPVLFRDAAELDVIAAEDWYESQRDGLGSEFREAVDAVISRIADHPLVYPERYRGVRRARVRRFPYVVWYRAHENVVVVLACVHGSRDPRAVRARLHDDA
jgi:plasmid stabilization system protein ParE